MATRDRCLSSIKDKTKADKSVNGQYSNLNLNKNHQCLSEDFVQPKNHFNKNHQSYDFKTDSNGKKESSSSWNKTTKNSDTFNLAIHDSDKKKKLKDQTKNSKCTVNNSTLSLHIAAYENSIIDSEISDGSTFDIGKSNCSKKLQNKTSFLTSSIIQNSFEFPRQQENGGGEPEVAQFKAAQKLLNPKDGNKRTSRKNRNNGEEKQPSKNAAEKSMLLPVSTVSRLTAVPPQPSTAAPPKTIRKTSSEERGKKHRDKHGKKHGSKTYRKKSGDRQNRSAKKISKSKEDRGNGGGGRTSKTRKDSSDKRRKHGKKPPPLEQGSEGKNGNAKTKQPSASCADCNTHDSDLDQESLLKNKKKKPAKTDLLLPKASAAAAQAGGGGGPQMDGNNQNQNNPTKASTEDDETLISVDAEMPELALPTYVLPEGEFEDPAPLGNDSSKKHRHTKE